MRELYRVLYGSKLYGTSTATSDVDFKVIYVPPIEDLLLLKKPKIFKHRFDADGNRIPDDGTPMPDRGTEVEFFPVQTFVREFVNGQTYAVEMAFALAHQGDPMMKEMIAKFGNKDVYSMVSFALKQTMDYVTRGERLNDAVKVREALETVLNKAAANAETVLDCPLEAQARDKIRLDAVLDGVKALDVISEMTDLKTGTAESTNKTLRTLELNGRSYLETSAMSHVIKAVDKLIKSYGERTSTAAKTSVDFKSLSHAIRVYQQVLELLDTGTITFPRPNAEFLLHVKQGKGDMEDVKELLRALDQEVQLKLETSRVRPRTPKLEQEADGWLMSWLFGLYGIKFS